MLRQSSNVATVSVEPHKKGYKPTIPYVGAAWTVVHSGPGGPLVHSGPGGPSVHSNKVDDISLCQSKRQKKGRLRQGQMTSIAINK